MSIKVAAKTFLAAGLLVFFSTSAYSQQDQQREATVYDRISPATIERVLRNLGLRPATSPAASGATRFSFTLGGFTLDGLQLNLFLYPAGDTLVMVCGIGDSNPQLLVANKWNEERIRSYTYVTEQGYILATDLSMTGGLTLEAVESFVQQFGIDVLTFIAYLNTFRVS